VPLSPNVEHDLSLRLLVEAAPGVSIGLLRECEFFAQAACAGGTLGLFSDGFAVGDTAGVWLTLTTHVTPPPTAVSGRCRFRLEAPSTADFDAFLDQAVLTGPDLIFADGFETGDTSAWGLCVGCAP